MAAAEDDLNERMSELYVAECNAAKARLEVETECRRLISNSYEKVMAQALEYSKKLEAPVLAKISDVGYFCDAHIVRTNQLTFEMGDNYYVECSLHTADKLIKHRVANLRKTREDGLESIRLIEDKIKFCQENFDALDLEGNPLEIVEQYDEEMEKKFYENRKKNKKNKEDADETPTDKMKRDLEHKKVMDRLAELEVYESQNEELRRVTQEVPVPVPQPFEVPAEELSEIIELEEVEEDESTSEQTFERLLAQPGVSQKEMESLLKYLDACDESSEEESVEDEEEEGEEKEEKEELDSDDYKSDEEPEKVVVKANTVEKPKKKAGVRFSQQLEEVKTFHQTDLVEIKEETTIETKSILRSHEPTPVDHSALVPEQKELAAMSNATFPGEIVEKDPYECQPSTSKDPAPVITEAKVSKFRASRKKN